jgi:hypothetical protein
MRGESPTSLVALIGMLVSFREVSRGNSRKFAEARHNINPDWHYAPKKRADLVRSALSALGKARSRCACLPNSGVEAPRPCDHNWCSVPIGEACRSTRLAPEGRKIVIRKAFLIDNIDLTSCHPTTGGEVNVSRFAVGDNHWRPHRSIGQRAPCAPATRVSHRRVQGGKVIALYQPAERMTREWLRHFESARSDSRGILVVIASSCKPTDSGRLGWGRFHSKRG